MDDLTFKPFRSEDMKPAFEIYKSGLHTVIEEAFGWHDDYQFERFHSRYKIEWFQWIEKDFERVGYLCFHAQSSDIHISLLIINQNLKSMGLGKKAMLKIHAQAFKENFKTVSLSSFKTNKTAIEFYLKLGYQIINEDEHFYDLRFLLNASI